MISKRSRDCKPNAGIDSENPTSQVKWRDDRSGVIADYLGWRLTCLGNAKGWSGRATCKGIDWDVEAHADRSIDVVKTRLVTAVETMKGLAFAMKSD